MKIGVAGLWQLGVMYAVEFAELGHLVTTYDPNSDSISGLRNGELLVFEPRLREMLLANLKTGNLRFTSDESNLDEIELLVIAYDTPVDEEDNADVNFTISEFTRIAKFLNSNAHIMLTSQLLVGSSDIIQQVQERYCASI